MHLDWSPGMAHCVEEGLFEAAPVGHFSNRSGTHDSSPVNNGNVGTQTFHGGHYMARKNHRASRLLVGTQNVLEYANRNRIDRFKRLVEEEDFRGMYECSS